MERHWISEEILDGSGQEHFELAPTSGLGNLAIDRFILRILDDYVNLGDGISQKVVIEFLVDLLAFLKGDFDDVVWWSNVDWTRIAHG